MQGSLELTIITNKSNNIELSELRRRVLPFLSVSLCSSCNFQYFAPSFSPIHIIANSDFHFLVIPIFCFSFRFFFIFMCPQPAFSFFSRLLKAFCLLIVCSGFWECSENSKRRRGERSGIMQKMQERVWEEREDRAVRG